jgi:dienelactone hydrolase
MAPTVSRRAFLCLGGLAALGGMGRLAAVLPPPASAATPTPVAPPATPGSRAMRVYFSDPQFDYQLLRLMGEAPGGGADIGECLSTAARIAEGDFESWHTGWLTTAQRLHAVADDALARGRIVSARETYLRASNYYRCAEFYLHGNPGDPRIRATYDASMACFGEFNALSTPRADPVKIPYQGTTLPGYFYSALGADGVPRPALIAQTGYDGTQEELLGTALAAVRRGYHCLTFEGPGQGRVIREQGLPFRPDWEQVVTPVVDYLLARPDVDAGKIALIGFSFGGYMVPRAAAFEHRLAAIVANGGVFCLFDEHTVPPGTTVEATTEWARNQPDAFNAQMEQAMQANTTLRWGIPHGMYVFQAATPADYWIKGVQYSMEGLADRITCPTLVIGSENDTSFPGQPKRLYDALTCPRTFLLFTAAEGAGEHCQAGAATLSAARTFDWLDETLGSA